MISFERDFTNKIKFQKVSSNFQNQSKEDIVSIKQNNSKQLLAFAEKTSDI